jgi:hypothetical protein
VGADVSQARSTTVHRIDDFASPHLPFPMRALNVALAPVAGRVRLDEADLLGTAMKKTGLADFGDDRFREPMRVFADALEREGNLSPLGRVLARQTILQCLSNRLLVQDALSHHPEILERPVTAPIVILGLPRTGTTHLHNLISRDPALRWMPYWESLQPLLPPGKEPKPGRPDPRVTRCEQSLRLLRRVMPLFPLMHEMACDLPHEEIQVLAMDFSTMLLESSNTVPSYGDWYKAHDQTPAYHYLRRVLQVMQWARGGERWVLKSPQHLEQIGPLLAAFPDAKIVQTHRDPVAVTASLCTMVAYGSRMQAAHIDPHAVGRHWSARVEDLLRASVRDRPLIPEDQVLDVRFHEFMADELGTVRRVYEFAGQPMTADAERAMQAYLDENPRGKLGRIEYHLEDFGLDAGERRAALRFYQERFDVPDE